MDTKTKLFCVDVYTVLLHRCYFPMEEVNAYVITVEYKGAKLVSFILFTHAEYEAKLLELKKDVEQCIYSQLTCGVFNTNYKPFKQWLDDKKHKFERG